MEKLLRKYTFPGLKRWFFFLFLAAMFIGLGFALIFKARPITHLYNFIWNILSFIADIFPPTISGIIALVSGTIILLYSFFKANKQVLQIAAPDEESLFDALDRQYMHNRGLKIVAIGGGTGLSNMIKGLKNYSSNITAVVTVADNGGSSGMLRKSMDIVPPGDIRNCIAALAPDDEVITKLFQYRFSDSADALKNHSFGNLFLTALVEQSKSRSMLDAVKKACQILKTRGKVIPVSDQPMHISAELINGDIIHGESEIPQADSKIKKIFTEGKPILIEEIKTAIADADIIILGPGSLYTSIIPNLLVPGLTEAILESEASKFYVCNIMTQPGETSGYTAEDHLKAILDHAGLATCKHNNSQLIDYIVVNEHIPESEILNKYKTDNQFPVIVNQNKLKDLHVKVRATNLVSKGSLVRHNTEKLSRTILKAHSRKKKLETNKK